MDHITVDVDNGLLRIGINRPNKWNAFNRQLIDELAQSYDQLAMDTQLRVGVLYAHGEHFSAGLDLGDVAPLLRAQGPQTLAGSGTYDPFGVWKDPVPKPVVMAVQGIAYTVAIELALAADVVVASADTRFRQLEVARGIMPFGGASFRAPARVGWGNAMRFLLTADEFGADEALRIGLVQEVVPVGNQLQRATALARRIAEQAPLGVQATLANARLHIRAMERAATGNLGEVVPRILSSEDAAEGFASFVERRGGVFSGR
jgi:enoyl-CoA hydratase/carnithine racemase